MGRQLTDRELFDWITELGTDDATPNAIFTLAWRYFLLRTWTPDSGAPPREPHRRGGARMPTLH